MERETSDPINCFLRRFRARVRRLATSCLTKRRSPKYGSRSPSGWSGGVKGEALPWPRSMKPAGWQENLSIPSGNERGSETRPSLKEGPKPVFVLIPAPMPLRRSAPTRAAARRESLPGRGNQAAHRRPACCGPRTHLVWAEATCGCGHVTTGCIWSHRMRKAVGQATTPLKSSLFQSSFGARAGASCRTGTLRDGHHHEALPPTPQSNITPAISCEPPTPPTRHRRPPPRLRTPSAVSFMASFDAGLPRTRWGGGR